MSAAQSVSKLMRIEWETRTVPEDIPASLRTGFKASITTGVRGGRC